MNTQTIDAIVANRMKAALTNVSLTAKFNLLSFEKSPCHMLFRSLCSKKRKESLHEKKMNQTQFVESYSFTDAIKWLGFVYASFLSNEEYMNMTSEDVYEGIMTLEKLIWPSRLFESEYNDVKSLVALMQPYVWPQNFVAARYMQNGVNLSNLIERFTKGASMHCTGTMIGVTFPELINGILLSEIILTDEFHNAPKPFVRSEANGKTR